MKQLKQLIKWVGNNAYEVALSVTCALVAVEILDTWACFGVLFVSFAVWGYRKANKTK